MKRTVASLGYGGRLDGYVIATSITGPPSTRNSETVETRQLIDGGNGHIQVRILVLFPFPGALFPCIGVRTPGPCSLVASSLAR